ncbi:MAG: LysR family transcriptional regulator [Desulfomicrobium sp.]|nr:LysR family transcriptional regulator [Desulfomicrobium sp.]MDP3430810.1 LysR family transcriptional regulator [Desulfomicrobium sp.]
MLNYKQLFYFWNVATAGGIRRAAERIHLTPQTLSGQIGELERDLGVKLFVRAGRRLEITEAGKLALARADEIFQIGNELAETLKTSPPEEALPFRVGLADSVPKSIAFRLLAPAFKLPTPIRLFCHRDKLENLFAELAIHKLELVIADRQLPAGLGVKAFNHPLGNCSITFFGVPDLARRYRPDFPRSLEGAPLLMPTGSVRSVLDRWFAEHGIHPHVVGEFDDTALLKTFGQAGLGLFPAPSVMKEEVRRLYNVDLVGEAEDVDVRYFAISAERRLTHPAVMAVSEHARQNLFVG